MLLNRISENLNELFRNQACVGSRFLNRLKDDFNERVEFRLAAVLALNGVRGATALAEDIIKRNKAESGIADICFFKPSGDPHLFYSLLGFLIKRTK
jgi:hypothetical protein